MQRFTSDGSRVRVCIPDCFVVPPVKPKEPPPFPGTVKPEDVRPPVDPPLPFLRPWAPHRKDVVTIAATSVTADVSIPCEVDAKMLEKHIDRHDVVETISAVFQGHPEDVKNSFIERTIASLASPFAAPPISENVDDPIVWTLYPAVRKNPAAYIAASGGKKSIHRHDRILRGPAWSIVSYGEESGAAAGKAPDGLSSWPGMIKRNVIYDGNGDAVAQVDFGHGDHVGTHCHALVVGSLDHKPGSADDHMFPLRSVPWFWVCVPDVRSARMLKRIERARLRSNNTKCDKSSESEGEDDASDFDDGNNDGDGTAAGGGDMFVSREDVLGGRYSAAVFDRQRGAKRFGLVDTSALDECGWAAINLPYEDYCSV
jgi:hypothetical protein